MGFVETAVDTEIEGNRLTEKYRQRVKKKLTTTVRFNWLLVVTRKITKSITIFTQMYDKILVIVSRLIVLLSV